MQNLKTPQNYVFQVFIYAKAKMGVNFKHF
jgi:hypothetical protein